VSRSCLARCRLGLGLPLVWALLAVLSCLNPRPDDQPLSTDSDGYGPPAVDVGGFGNGSGGSDPGSDGSPASGPDDTDTGTVVPGGSDADAGPPSDAGPLDEPDAGALDD
jgi:hypothetical protein